MSQPDFELHQDASGAFYLDGPAAYMDARGIELMNAILDQSDVLLDQLLLRHTDWRQAVLRRFQLDYANWKGIEGLIRDLPIADPQPALFVLDPDPPQGGQ